MTVTYWQGLLNTVNEFVLQNFQSVYKLSIKYFTASYNNWAGYGFLNTVNTNQAKTEIVLQICIKSSKP